MKNYPSIAVNATLQAVISVLSQIIQYRNNEDVPAFNNLNKVFILGRLTARVPSSDTDVMAGDLVGDFCPTATFLYILVANSGTPAWRRITMGTF